MAPAIAFLMSSLLKAPFFDVLLPVVLVLGIAGLAVGGIIWLGTRRVRRRRTSPEEMDRLRRLRSGGHLRYVLYGVFVGMGYALIFAFVISRHQTRPFFDVLPWTILVCGVPFAVFGEIGWRFICAKCDRDEQSPPA